MFRLGGSKKSMINRPTILYCAIVQHAENLKLPIETKHQPQTSEKLLIKYKSAKSWKRPHSNAKREHKLVWTIAALPCLSLACWSDTSILGEAVSYVFFPFSYPIQSSMVRYMRFGSGGGFSGRITKQMDEQRRQNILPIGKKPEWFCRSRSN